MPTVLPHVVLHVADILYLVDGQLQPGDVRREVVRDVVQVSLTHHALLLLPLAGADCPAGPSQ